MRLHELQYLPVTLFASGTVIGLMFQSKGWSEFWGFMAFLTYICWNIFAFIYKRNMLALPKMTMNVKRDGDQGARQFLFAVCLFSWFLLNVLWIWRCFN